MPVQRGERRLRHKEFVYPVVVGTCAFYLGKKVCLVVRCSMIAFLPCKLISLTSWLNVTAGNRDTVPQMVSVRQRSKWGRYRSHREEGIKVPTIGRFPQNVRFDEQALTGAETFSHSQVVFNLHPTFPNPTREVTVHPFEIEEHGWGEFELNVTVLDHAPVTNLILFVALTVMLEWSVRSA